MNTTSSIKIFEERNTTYSLGEELRFLIPKSVLTLNPLHTFITCNLEVKTELANAYALNQQAGAELLVKQVRILSQDGSAVFEEISDYNKLKRILSYYGNNKTDDNLNQLFQGGQEPAPILLGNNKLFDISETGTITQKKLPVQFRLSLSGLLGSSRPFPNMLCGLQIVILLENDINKVLRKMGEYKLPRVLNDNSGVNKINKKLFNDIPGYAPTSSYQIAGIDDKDGNFLTGAGSAGYEFCVGIHLNTLDIDADVDDNVNIEPDAFQVRTLVDAVNNPTGAIAPVPFKVGQKVSVFKRDLSGTVEFEIGSLSNSGDGRLILGCNLTDNPDGVDIRGGAANNGAGKVNSGVALLEPNQYSSVSGFQSPSTLELSNVEMVVGTINLKPEEISKIQSAAGSSTGFQHDIQSYLNYPQNITKALTNSVFIPTKLNRCKSVLTFYESVGGGIDTSRDNLLPIIDADTAPSRYNYKINNLIVPSRKVELANLNKAPDEAGAWSSIHLHELQKALQSSISVRSLEATNECFVIGRQLAVMNHTYDSNTKGEMRMELEFTHQTRDLLIHNFIHHIRRIIISGQGIMVEM